MRVTQPFGFAQGREPVERQMVVFGQPLGGLFSLAGVVENERHCPASGILAAIAVEEGGKRLEKTKIGPSTHLHPKPAVLVGALVDDKPNFMTVSWCGIASQEPPAMSVAIRKIRHTLTGIHRNGTFSVNIPGVDLARKVDFCGIHSGRERDKSDVFHVFYGESKTAPLVEECPVNFECRVMHSLDLGSHILVIGEILETHVFSHLLTDNTPDVKKIDPLVYASGTTEYHRVGEAVGRAYRIGKSL